VASDGNGVFGASPLGGDAGTAAGATVAKNAAAAAKDEAMSWPRPSTSTGVLELCDCARIHEKSDIFSKPHPMDLHAVLSQGLRQWHVQRAAACPICVPADEIAFSGSILRASGETPSIPGPSRPTWHGVWRFDDAPASDSLVSALLATSEGDPARFTLPPPFLTVGFAELAGIRDRVDAAASLVARIVTEELLATGGDGGCVPVVSTPPSGCPLCAGGAGESPLDRAWSAIGGWRGAVVLSGCRVTVGTIPALPPPLSTLLRSFNDLYTDPTTPDITTKPAAPAPACPSTTEHTHAAGGAGAACPPAPPSHDGDAAGGAGAGMSAETDAGSKPRRFPPKPKPPVQPLTVGARAHAKHAHRDSTGWWGTAAGTVAVRNANAEATIRRILADAVWVNVHAMVHDTPLLEVRVTSGHGARWSADGAFFRGFLEPPMAGGHDAGWRH